MKCAGFRHARKSEVAVPRKRKRINDLRTLDPKSPAYWEEVLQREGLNMAVGRSDRLSYVGGASHLETIHGVRQQDVGRVAPKVGDD